MSASLRPQVRAGHRISGTYHGVPFRGIVRSERCNTMNWNLLIVFVKLDEPISVYGGQPNDSLCVEVDFTTLQGRFDTAITGEG